MKWVLLVIFNSKYPYFNGAFLFPQPSQEYCGNSISCLNSHYPATSAELMLLFLNIDFSTHISRIASILAQNISMEKTKEIFWYFLRQLRSEQSSIGNISTKYSPLKIKKMKKVILLNWYSHTNTLKCLINVRRTFINFKVFSHQYFLIRNHTFIKFGAR